MNPLASVCPTPPEPMIPIFMLNLLPMDDVIYGLHSNTK
jgi:hypothetical protein